MKKCVLKNDIDLATWYENEIQKIDSKILELKIGRPALRALINEKIYTIDALMKRDLNNLIILHGMGPSAIKKLSSLFN